jgi:hypothetical protein
MLFGRLMHKVMEPLEVVKPVRNQKRLSYTLDQLKNQDSLEIDEIISLNSLLGGIVIALLGGGQLASLIISSIDHNRSSIVAKISGRPFGDLSTIVISTNPDDPAARQDDLHIVADPNSAKDLAEVFEMLYGLGLQKDNTFALPDSDHIGIDDRVINLMNPLQRDYFETIRLLQNKLTQFEKVNQIETSDLSNILKPNFFAAQDEMNDLDDEELLKAISTKMSLTNMSSAHFKITKEGYDGKGILQSDGDVENLLTMFKKFGDGDLSRGLQIWKNKGIAAFESIENPENYSFVIASDSSNIHFYPPVKITEKNNKLLTAIALAQPEIPSELVQEIQEYVMRMKAALPGAGIFAFEFLVSKTDGKHSATLCEISPRTHNSGHITDLGPVDTPKVFGRSQHYVGPVLSSRLMSITGLFYNPTNLNSTNDRKTIQSRWINPITEKGKVCTKEVLQRPVALVNLLCKPVYETEAYENSLYQAKLQIKEGITKLDGYGTKWTIRITDYDKDGQRPLLKTNLAKLGHATILFGPDADLSYIQTTTDNIQECVYFEAVQVS